MAKATKKKVATPKSKVKLFYANKDKYERAVALKAEGKFKTVKAAYESLAGLFSEGGGYMEV